MNYQALNYTELERLVYANGDPLAMAELAKTAIEAEEAFEESKSEIDELASDADEWRQKRNDLKQFLAQTVRERIESALDLIDGRFADRAAEVLESTLDAIDAETSL